MSEKLLFLAIVPTVTLIIMLCWVWLITKRQKSTKLTLSGLGIKIEFTTDESPQIKEQKHESDRNS